MAESSNELKTAATLYAEGLKEQPDNNLLAGRAYANAVEVGDFDLALKAVRTMQSHGIANPEMPLLRYADAFAQRDWTGTKLAIADLNASKNFAFMSPFLKAWEDTARGRDATTAIAQAQASNTAKYYLEEQLILNTLASGRDQQALALLARVVERDEPRMAPVRLLAAQHFLAKNDETTAREILKKGSSGPEQRLLASITAGQTKDVAQKVTPAIGLAFLFQRLSSDLAVQQAEFLALVMAQSGKRIAGQSDYGHLILGRAYAESESHQLAVAEFAAIPPASPYYLVGISSRIASLVAAGDFDQAIVGLDSAIENDADAPELHILKGQSLQAKGDNAAAAGSFQTAIALAEKLGRSDALMANYWLALGGVQEQAGMWPEALQSLQKANELLPNSPSILNYLGYSQLERRENQAAAVAAIKQAHDLRSSSPAITDSLGWAYFIIGDHDKAVTYLESAREGQPEDPTINEHLGDAYWAVGRRYEARYAWKSAKLFAEGEDMQRLASKIDLGLQPELVSP